MTFDPTHPADTPTAASAAAAAEAEAAQAAAAAEAQAARSDARAKRIAAAVARSKAEYTAEHAYTERGWFTGAELAGPSKHDRQRVEYASTHRLVCTPESAEEAARALADIRACAGSKPLKSLPRELVATGARAAVLAADAEMAREFALAAKSNWRVSVGTAMASSEALEFAGDVAQATHPLVTVTSQGIHHPVLLRLISLLTALNTPNCLLLNSVLGPLAESRAWAFARPLFGGTDKPRAGGSPPGADALRATLNAIDRAELARELAGVERNSLDAALGRISRALGSAEEEPEVVEGERVERGVREL